jgi:hypothetical protein
MRDKKIIDAEFEVIEGPHRPESPPPPHWQFWKYHWHWSPWPLIGAGLIGLPFLLRALGKN